MDGEVPHFLITRTQEMLPNDKLRGPASIVEVYSFPQRILPSPESAVSKSNLYEPKQLDLVENFDELYIET
jgi:hypothetical protein